jgi:hypothetical protein
MDTKSEKRKGIQYSVDGNQHTVTNVGESVFLI